jgi:hypothetical protein
MIELKMFKLKMKQKDLAKAIDRMEIPIHHPNFTIP